MSLSAGVIFEYGTSDFGSNMPRRKRALKKRHSALIEIGLGEQALIHGVDDRGALGAHLMAIIAADHVHAGLERDSDALFGVGAK